MSDVMSRPSARTLRRVAMIAVSAALMGAVAYGLDLVVLSPLSEAALPVRAGAVLFVIGAAAAVYLALAIVTGAVDRSELRTALRRRRA